MDKEKFIQILKENKWLLYKVITTYCKDTEDRKDLEQEILIQLWKSVESYNNQYKISTWIYKIAMNVSISFYRSNINRKSRTSQINESIFQVADQIDNSVSVDEERKFLSDFINQLDDLNKEILVLYLDNLSYKEIAEIVGITESNVGTKINRIKNKLQENYVKINNVSHGTR
jgi:RNA polymerase sigma-70 factor (ECF subfamily)